MTRTGVRLPRATCSVTGIYGYPYTIEAHDKGRRLSDVQSELVGKCVLGSRSVSTDREGLYLAIIVYEALRIQSFAMSRASYEDLIDILWCNSRTTGSCHRNATSSNDNIQLDGVNVN